MKKPFNLRLPVLWAVSLILGIVYSTVLLYFKLDGIFILIPAIISFSACVPVAILRRRDGKPLILFTVGVFLLIGSLYAYARGISFTLTDAPLNGVTKIAGRVTDTGISSNGVRYAVLGGATAGGIPLKGKLVAYLSEEGGNYFRVGYKVSFFSQLQLNDLIEYGDLSYYACRNYKYRCYVSGGLTAHYGFSIFGEINYALESALKNNLDGETAAVCIALITGNTDGVSAETLSAFRNGGIAHVFAVSGLHIGVIYAVLTAVFKKLGVNRFVSAAVRVVLITLYAGVCGFSPSSVRAVVTCSAAVAATCARRKSDGLNAIAVSAIILLLINPYYLFDVGFALSYGAVLGILLTSRNLNRLLVWLPPYIRRPLATGIAVYLGTVPTMLTAFETVSVAGLFLNLIFIPLVSAEYVLLFAGTMLGAVCPFLAGTVLPVSALPVQLMINIIADFGFGDAVVSADVTRWIYLPFLAVTAALTDKLNFRPLARTAILCTAVTVLTVAVALSSPKSVASVTFSAGYSGGSVKINSSAGTVLIITSDFQPRSTYYEEIDALIVVARDDYLPAINMIDGEVDKIYLCGSAIYTPSVGVGEVICADNFTACGIEFTFEGWLLTFNLCGEDFAVESSYQGDMYGAIENFYDYKLTCYHNYAAVLQSPSGEVNLARCGSVRLEIRKGKLLPSYVVAKE